ncbi:MAG: DNA polymerase III subunit beta [Bacteroidaceae bacterium]|jgi:DNA polymerase-3 subunit beta
MRFTVSSTELFGLLQTLSRVINAKNAMSILDCFLFEVEGQSLTVVASDGENRITGRTDVAEAEGEIRFAVSAKMLLDAIKEIPEQPVVFDVDEENYEMVIGYRNGSYKIVGQPAEDYPAAPDLHDDRVRFEMDADKLQLGVNSTFFAVGSDEFRPVMTGIYFDITPGTVVMVASDGRKLSRATFDGLQIQEQRAAFILPSKPAGLLKNILPKVSGAVQIEFDARHAVFQLPTYRIEARLLEGRYPNYNSVIPQDNPYHLTFDRLQLISVLRRVSVFSDSSNNQVKLTIDPGRVLFTAQDIDFSTSAEELIECDYQGGHLEIAFNGNYFLETLNNLSSQNVSIDLGDSSRAGVVQPVEQTEGAEQLMLIMPVLL